MMQKLIGIIVFYFCLLGGVYAQKTQEINKKALSFFRDAKEAFREGKDEKALELLDKAKSYDAGFSGLYLLQADIFDKKGRHDDEIKAIETALALDSLKSYPYYFWMLAEDSFDRADYVKAREYYLLYLNRDSRQKAAEQANKQLKNCDFAIEALRNQVKQPVEVFYQAEKPVYWPALDVRGETMLFTEQDGGEEKMWMLKEGIRYPLNFKTLGNYGAPSMSADGQTMYFSMNGGRSGFDIYVSHRLSDTVWSEPFNLGYPVNTDGWDAQPAVSADGTKLYFASTREGGRGGSDIWFSRLLGRSANGRQMWSQPRCLYFNTEGDEMAPFLYFDNRTLFFASNAYPGMGRKDIYRVDLDEVSTPKNIGITINSQKEEFGFIVDGSGQWGYFSSDVNGKRCIYRYRLDEQVGCRPANYVCLETENEFCRRIAPDYLTLVDVATGDTLACYGNGAATERMLACVPANRLLLVGAMKQGYLYYSDTLRVAESEKPQVYTVCLKTIRQGQTLVLKGVFFDVDDYRLKPESYTELQQLAEFLRKNPEVKIEISGHTDNTGNDKYNYQLSENRAFEVYKYLFLKRISKDRMDYRGYGKDKPIAPNDTEEGRGRNRRTEIRIR